MVNINQTSDGRSTTIGFRRLLQVAAQVGFLALAVMLPYVASAQDEDAGEGSDSLDDEFAFLQEEVLVESAARRSQPISLSPSAITLITREEVEASGARVIPEVLRLVPNMDVLSITPFWYEIGIRGGRPYMGIDMVMLMVDGRDATFEFLGFPAWTAQHFSMDEVERIEVVRGPGSALYGANAFAGVVSVKTFAPGEGPRALASLRAGEHGTSELSCRVSENLGPLSVSVSGGWIKQDLWTGRGQTGMELVRGRAQAKVDLGDQTSLHLDGGAYQTSGRGRVGWGESQFRDIVNLYGRVRLQHDELVLQAVYDYLSMDIDLGANLWIGDLLVFRVPPTVGDLKKIGLMAQHGFEGFNNRLTYGVEYLLHYYQIDNFKEPEMLENRIGIFLQDEIDLAGIFNRLRVLDFKPLFLTAGLRVDYNNVSRWEASPRISLVFQPSESHSFRVGYAHAFLKPKLLEARLNLRVEDVMGMGIDQIRYVATDDLGNETIDSMEFGYQGNYLEGRLLLKFDYAYSYFADAVELFIDEDLADFREIGTFRFPDPSGPGFLVRNSEDHLYGHNLEIQFAVRPIAGIHVFAIVGYRKLYEEHNTIKQAAAYEPGWRLSTGLDLSSGKGFSATFRAFFTDSHKSRTAIYPGGFLTDKLFPQLPASWLLNARLAWKIAPAPFEIQAGVEAFNLLGTHFREMAGSDIPNRPDWVTERQDRRIVLFLRGQM